MKKKKRNFIIKIFSLLLLGIISVTLLGSWTYDPQNDTITSDNLLDPSSTYTDSNNNTGYLFIPSNSGFYTFSIRDIVSIISCDNLDLNTNVMFSYNSNTLTFNFTSGVRYGFFCNNNDSWNAMLLQFEPMINLGSTKIDYEPYGQTYINNTIYENLELDYEELYDKYQNLNDSYNSLQNNYNLLEANYNNLESQYNSLQSDYNTLESNYNNLSSRYSTLTDEYDTLLEEKQELQQQLADLNNELALLRPYIFNSSDIVVKIGNSTNTGDNFVATSVVSNVSSYFDIYGSFDLDSLYTNYTGFGSSYNAICFEVPNYNLMMYNVSFSFTGFPDMLYRLNYQDSVGNNLVISQDFTNSYTDLYGFSIVSGLRNSSLWDSSQPIEYCTYSKIVFVGLNTGALNVKNLNFSSSAGYSEGFNQGYNSIKNQTDLIITRLNNQIDTLNLTIDNLHTQITDLQNQLANSIGWRPLFFAMADTPLKVVSNVLGFELFGINLFQAFIGIITALAIIWLIRKIWK